MKELTLSVLLMSLMVISALGVVSAQSGDIIFTIESQGKIVSPSDGSHVRGDVLISWENGDFEVGWLKYKEGACDETASGEILAYQITEEGNYLWNTNTEDTPDGEYCIKITGTETIFGSITVTIDNTVPNVIMSDISFPAPDEKNNPVKVGFVYNDNIGVTFCEIDFGGMKTKDCLSGSQKSYQFKDNENYDITITVRDEAENEATLTVPVYVANVDPEITAQIDAPNNVDEDLSGLKEAAVGEAVKFTASGSDVIADLKNGLTCTWRFDGANPEPTVVDESGNCKVFHTWNSARVHTVDLTITDKDGGSVDADQFELEVEQPEPMTPMQQVVANEVFGFELDDKWAVPNKKRFKTTISGITDCDGVVVPTGMVISQQGPTTPDGRCQVDWKPTNDERGKHLVIIKAYNSFYDEYKYYSFDVTVYSWGIELEEGWNLISIPLVPTKSDIESVFADIIDNVAYEGTNTATVLQYDAVANKWYKARPYDENRDEFTWSSSSSKLTNVVPGYGYWVKMDKEDWIYGIEENFNPGQGLVPSVQLSNNGWNLIGRYGTNPKNMGNLNKAFRTLQSYWFKEGFLKFDGVSSFQKATSIDVGNGYWLRTKILPNGQTSIAYEPLNYYFD